MSAPDEDCRDDELPPLPEPFEVLDGEPTPPMPLPGFEVLLLPDEELVDAVDPPSLLEVAPGDEWEEPPEGLLVPLEAADVPPFEVISQVPVSVELHALRSATAAAALT